MQREAESELQEAKLDFRVCPLSKAIDAPPSIRFALILVSFSSLTRASLGSVPHSSQPNHCLSFIHNFLGLSEVRTLLISG